MGVVVVAAVEEVVVGILFLEILKSPLKIHLWKHFQFHLQRMALTHWMSYPLQLLECLLQPLNQSRSLMMHQLCCHSLQQMLWQMLLPQPLLLPQKQNWLVKMMSLHPWHWPQICENRVVESVNITNVAMYASLLPYHHVERNKFHFVMAATIFC